MPPQDANPTPSFGGFGLKLAVEALNIPILPRATRCDEEGCGSHPLEPQPHRPGGELRPVVRAEVLRHATLDHEVPQAFNGMG